MVRVPLTIHSLHAVAGEVFPVHRGMDLNAGFLSTGHFTLAFVLIAPFAHVIAVIEVSVPLLPHHLPPAIEVPVSDVRLDVDINGITICIFSLSAVEAIVPAAVLVMVVIMMERVVASRGGMRWMRRGRAVGSGSSCRLRSGRRWAVGMISSVAVASTLRHAVTFEGLVFHVGVHLNANGISLIVRLLPTVELAIPITSVVAAVLTVVVSAVISTLHHSVAHEVFVLHEGLDLHAHGIFLVVDSLLSETIVVVVVILVMLGWWWRRWAMGSGSSGGRLWSGRRRSMGMI